MELVVHYSSSAILMDCIFASLDFALLRQDNWTIYRSMRMVWETLPLSDARRLFSGKEIPSSLCPSQLGQGKGITSVTEQQNHLETWNNS